MKNSEERQVEPVFPNDFTIQFIFLPYVANLFTIFFHIFHIISQFFCKIMKRYGKYRRKL
jgi:hypothetical protein